MNQITDTGRIKSVTSRSITQDVPHLDEEILQRVTGLIRLGVGVLNSLICIRFLLKLMAANPANPFAQLIYAATQPFLRIFQGLIRVLTVNGSVFELHDLIAITVYAMLGWVAVQLIRILFARVT
jgi:YggT family protein